MAKVDNGVIFIAGTYGVGKSTLCSSLSKALSVPCFSAGDLISKINGEKYGANKVVANKNANQDTLVSEVQKLLHMYNLILLAGHFCIFAKDNKVELLPDIVFETMPIALIVLLETEISVIEKHLQNRDGKNYRIEEIEKLQKSEYEQAVRISTKLSIPFICHDMQYSSRDVENLSKIIENGSEIT